MSTEMFLCSNMCSSDQTYGQRRLDIGQVFFCVRTDQDRVEAYKQTRTKETEAKIQSSYGLCFGFREIFLDVSWCLGSLPFSVEPKVNELYYI